MALSGFIRSSFSLFHRQTKKSKLYYLWLERELEALLHSSLQDSSNYLPTIYHQVNHEYLKEYLAKVFNSTLFLGNKSLKIFMSIDTPHLEGEPVRNVGAEGASVPHVLTRKWKMDHRTLRNLIFVCQNDQTSRFIRYFKQARSIFFYIFCQQKLMGTFLISNVCRS